mgnify:FL=1
MVEEKNCIICGERKELSAYYRHKKMYDGHLNKCKECTKNQSKARGKKLRESPEFIELEKIRQREKYHRLNYKEKHKPVPEKKKEAQLRHKEKYTL